MAEFGENEKKLLKRIPASDPLYTNLAQIRETVEKIWVTEAPRVINDYTDHGVKHCGWRTAERRRQMAGPLALTVSALPGTQSVGLG